MVTIKDINGAIRVGYSGKELGNTNPRFSEDGDDNFARFIARFPGKTVFDMYAVGQDKILNIDNLQPAQADEIECDALVSTKPGNLLVLKAADCIPLVFYVPSKLLCLAHVGRPGAMAHLPRKVIDYLAVDPAELKVYFGPAISTDSYKFPAEQFDKKLDPSWDKYILKRGDFIHIDLQAYVMDELKTCGIREENIVSEPEDTGGPDYFSHRRHRLTGEPSGRNAFAVHLL